MKINFFSYLFELNWKKKNNKKQLKLKWKNEIIINYNCCIIIIIIINAESNYWNLNSYLKKKKTFDTFERMK